MKFPMKWLALPLACLTVMPIAGAAEAVTPAERDAIVATVRDAAAQSLKLEAGRLHLVPEQLQRRADWVFLTTQMQDAAGKRFDYAGTDQAEAARHGGKSDLCAALLHREGSTWKLVDIAVGPTDVAWENWAEKHKAPAELFK